MRCLTTQYTDCSVEDHTYCVYDAPDGYAVVVFSVI